MSGFSDSHRPIYRGQRQSRMVEITNVDCTQSICEAYVILKQPLKFGTIDSQFDIHKIKNESSSRLSLFHAMHMTEYEANLSYQPNIMNCLYEITI